MAPLLLPDWFSYSQNKFCQDQCPKREEYENMAKELDVHFMIQLKSVEIFIVKKIMKRPGQSPIVLH